MEQADWGSDDLVGPEAEEKDDGVLEEKNAIYFQSIFLYHFISVA